MNDCFLTQLGCVDYDSAYELQQQLAKLVKSGKIPGILLLLEHPHVFTMGRRGSRADILTPIEHLQKLGVTIHETDRGGEVTYHGHGQLVGYPIVDTRTLGGPISFIRKIQECLITTLADFNIVGDCFDRPTGVWVGESKIAAIGLHISRGISTHGFALNVAPDLSYFDHIVACGLPGSPATSVEREAGISDTTLVSATLTRHMENIFDWRLQTTTLEELVPELTSI